MEHFCRLIAIALFTLVSGCTTVGDMTRINPDPLFPMPGTAVDLSGTAYSNLNVDSVDQCETAWIKSNLRVIPSDVERFTAATACALRGNKKHWARFADVGKSLSEHQCAVFLDSLEDRRVHVAYNQTNLNTVIAAATAFLAKGHAQSVFNIATGAVASNALIENYKSHYIMSNSIHQLKEKIVEVQSSLGNVMATRIKAQSYESFDDAKDDLLVYSDWCSHKSLVFIINKSLSETKLVLDTPGTTLADTVKAGLFERAKAADPSITVKALTDEQFAYLFALANLEQTDRKAVIDLLDKVTSGVTGWKLALKDEDLGKIVKALKLSEKSADKDVQSIKNIGRASGYDQGRGFDESQTIEGIFSSKSLPPPTQQDAQRSAPPKATKEKSDLSVREARQSIRSVPKTN
jgi:hypothetical protein